MLSIDEFISTLLSCKSTEYQEYFNSEDDITILVQNATEIIQEVKETALRGGCESHLDALLSAMLDHAPCLQGQRYVAVVLHVARGHSPEMVIEVARTWRRLFFEIILQFIKAKRLPRIPPIPFDEEPMEKEPRDLIDKVAERERYYCAITGTFDSSRAKLLTIQRRDLPPCTNVVPLQAVYIIPLTPSLFESHGTSEKKTVGLMQAVFEAWTCLDKLKINDPSNTIYMTPDMGELFRRFDFYLKVDSEKPNAYRAYEVMGKRPLFHGETMTEVVFHNSDEESIPIAPPSSKLLGIRAAFAQVSYLSGIFWDLQSIESDFDDED